MPIELTNTYDLSFQKHIFKVQLNKTNKDLKFSIHLSNSNTILN
jgi:hypothetical protein